MCKKQHTTQPISSAIIKINTEGKSNPCIPEIAVYISYFPCLSMIITDGCVYSFHGDAWKSRIVSYFATTSTFLNRVITAFSANK